jgi:hypothetical protein
MTQISFITQESFKKGAKRSISLPAIAPLSFLQYTKDHVKLRDVIRKYGYFNQITVMNNSTVTVNIELDFNDAKTYPIPANSTISIDEIMYQEFNIKNMDAAGTAAANTINIIAGFERPMIRENVLPKKLLGGR